VYGLVVLNRRHHRARRCGVEHGQQSRNSRLRCGLFPIRYEPTQPTRRSGGIEERTANFLRRFVCSCMAALRSVMTLFNSAESGVATALVHSSRMRSSSRLSIKRGDFGRLPHVGRSFYTVCAVFGVIHQRLPCAASTGWRGSGTSGTQPPSRSGLCRPRRTKQRFRSPHPPEAKFEKSSPAGPTSE
jgi:hypothetical protein